MNCTLNKLGNTSQSIVTVPSSFLTHDLKPVELFTLSKRDTYFKEKSLFSHARLLNINNNPIKHHRKFDEYNTQKYIPIHKLASIPPPDNSFNPHYRRDCSIPTNKFITSHTHTALKLLNKDIDNDNQLINDFDLFSNLKVDEAENDTAHQTQDINLPKWNYTQYQMHKPERYNKHHAKYDILKKPHKPTLNHSIRSTHTQLPAPTLIKPSKPTDTALANTQKSLSSSNLMTKLEKDFLALEAHHHKSSTFNTGNFVKDFRIKIDNLLDRINSNFDTEKFMNTDHVSLFNKLNDTMFTPLTYYNKNYLSETTKFRNTLQNKITNLTSISPQRKDTLLKHFNKTTNYNPQPTPITSTIHPPPHDNTTSYAQLLNSLKPQDFPTIMQYTIPQINNNNLTNINNHNSLIYERYKPSKLFSDYPSPTLAEFTKRNGEKFSNRSKANETKNFKQAYIKEQENPTIPTIHENKHKYNFEDKSKYDSLKI
jgi:hypothetical protein